MPEEVVAVVRRWVASLGEGDPAPEMCHPGVEIVNWAESPAPGPYRGRDGVRGWWSDLEDSISGVRFECEEIEPIDANRALTTQRLVGTFHHTGIEVDWRWGSIISVRDGQIANATGYATPGKARRAAGLE